MVTCGTRTDDGGTRIVDGSTVMVGDGMQMSDDQYRLGSAIASMSWSRHHQAKQHPHICWHKVKIQSCTLRVTELDSINIIAHMKIGMCHTRFLCQNQVLIICMT
jgi:hypothetical protein